MRMTFIMLVMFPMIHPGAARAQSDELGRKKQVSTFYRPSVESMRMFSKPLEKPIPVNRNKAGAYQLTAQEAKMTIPDPDQPMKTRTVVLYSYNGQSSGPIITASPGQDLRIELTNHLPAKPKDEPVNPGENDPHGFHLTNLHTHGLNVTPDDPGDNIFREIPSGKSHLFRYQILKDHPPGTYFYHPHKHGSVGYQVACGMVGALIVRDDTRGLDAVPEIKAASEQVLVIQQLVMKQDLVSLTWSSDPKDFYYGIRPTPVTAINGQIAPKITLKKREVVRWRIVHGGIEDRIPLTIVPARKGAAAVPQMYQIARDGIPFLAKLRPSFGAIANCLDLSPGYRAEVLVQAPDAEGEFLLQAASVTAKQSLRAMARDSLPLAYIQVTGDAGPTDATALPSDATIAKYTKDVRPNDLSKKNVFVRRTFALKSDDVAATFQIDGMSFDSKRTRHVFLKDACEEWILEAFPNLNNHPFHVHINPFQLIAVNGTPIAEPLWADTLLVEMGNTYTVRSCFRNWTGSAVLHCHILDHEDAGMMMKMAVRDPADAGNARSKDIVLQNRPFPGLTLKTVGGEDIGFGPEAKTSVLVFFQGPSCPSCVQQLKSFVKSRRDWQNGNIRLIAVSSEPITDHNKLIDRLDIHPGEPVLLCHDPSLAAFRKMGCEDDGPLHGTFIVTRNRVVWGEVDFMPFTDTKRLSALIGIAQGAPVDSSTESVDLGEKSAGTNFGDDLSGRWLYRSFISDPIMSDPEKPLKQLLFGQGDLVLNISPEGMVTGSLSGAGWQLTLTGTAQKGMPSVLKFDGKGTIGGEPWWYSYVGYAVPKWKSGKNQRPALVGSIMRATAHSDGMGGIAPAGYVAQWIAVRQDEPAVLKALSRTVPKEVDKRIRKLEDEWAAAVQTNKADNIQTFFTDDFAFVGPKDILQTAKQHLDDFRTGKLKVDSIAIKAIKVEVFGNVAVSNTQATVKGTYNKTALNGDYIFVDTWKFENGNWLAFVRQQKELKNAAR